MPAKLFCKTGELKGREFAIDREATIGSGPANSIVLASRTISRGHARITLDEHGRYLLHDLGSSNGTEVDNRPVRGSEPLGELHVITFAREHDFIFQVCAAGAITQAAETSAISTPVRATRPQDPAAAPQSPKPVDSSDGATRYQPVPGLVVPGGIGRGGPSASSGPVTGPEPAGGPGTIVQRAPHLLVPDALHRKPGTDPQAPSAPAILPAAASHWHLETLDATTGASVSHRLVEGDHRVGRARDCDVWIDSATLSRAHAQLTVRGGHLTIADLGSANGTFVDNVRIAAPVEAREGMTVRFGEVKATLVRKSERS